MVLSFLKFHIDLYIREKDLILFIIRANSPKLKVSPDVKNVGKDVGLDSKILECNTYFQIDRFL